MVSLQLFLAIVLLFCFNQPSFSNVVYAKVNDSRCMADTTAIKKFNFTDYLRCVYQCYVNTTCVMISLNLLKNTCLLFGALQANSFFFVSSNSQGTCLTWVQYGVTMDAHFALFESNGNFTVPNDVSSLAVLAVGGGGTGGNSDNGGGGSGYVVFANIAVTPGQTFYVSIGKGGGSTTFGGTLLVAQSGSSTSGYTGGSGGSGGGAGYGTTVSVNGGSAGSNGNNNGPFLGGNGQGSNFTAFFSQFRLNNLTAGSGATGLIGSSNIYHVGGAGGGGVLINGTGPNSTGGQCKPNSTYCGPGPARGYGAGGSAGCWAGTGFFGGAGASGVVYIEWL